MLSYVPLKHRTHELCLSVVGNRTYGYMLRYVPEQHRDAIMCLIALHSNKNAIKYVPDQFKNLID